MKIYVVSIEDEKSPRLSKFLSQNFFEQGNLTITKVGVKGGDLSAKEYFEKAVKGREIALTPGELGCTLSHLQALQFFLDTDDQYALILEDDAIFPTDLTYEILEKQIDSAHLPSKILLSLGGIQMKESRKVRGTFKQESFLDKKILEVIPDYFHRVNYAMAYIVDRDMAKVLLAYHQPLRRADDWSYLFDFDSHVHLLMTHIIDHPVIQKGEKNQELSAIEAERVDTMSLKKSKYGTSIRRNVVKMFSQLYSNK